MKNVSLGHRTVADINGQVAKVLRGLGDPEPPVDLRLVRELLKLDRGYPRRRRGSWPALRNAV